MFGKKLLVALAISLVIGMSMAGCSSSRKSHTKETARTESAPATVTSHGWPTRKSSAQSVWTARAFPTGDARSSAVGIEKGVPTEVRLNEDFSYQIVVKNLTGDALEDVIVRDIPGEGLKLRSSDPKGRIDAGDAVWNLGDLGPNESRVINVTAVASQEGSVGSCADVTYAASVCMSVPVVSPKLMLTKRAPSDVLKCEPIVYTLEVKNTGTGTVSNVRVSDPLPDGLRTADGKSTVTFDAGTLAAGQAKQFSARVMASRTGKFTNKATATGSGGLSAKSDDVVTTVRAPKLSIDKTCPETMFIGRPIEYKITLKNTGDGDARDTVLEDRLPAGVTAVSASDNGQVAGGVVRWSLGTMRPGATRTVTVRMTSRNAGTLVNRVTANAFCADAVSDRCTTEITGIPAILLEVIDLEDPVEVGNNTTYVITVTNQGSADSTNVKLVCTLETNQEFVSATGATRGSGRDRTVTFEPLARLAPKDKATFSVVVRNVKAGDVRFRATMTSDRLTREVIETEATNVYE